MKSQVCCFVPALVLILAGVAGADPVPIDSYDIEDAVLSGWGSLAHTYTGAIVPGVNFTHQASPGQTAEYSSGDGTLNDGVIGTDQFTIQAFISPQASDGTPINPVITLVLPDVYTIDFVDIFGGELSNNVVPGTLTGATIELFGPGGSSGPVALVSTPFGPDLGQGPVNDRLELGGTSLENFAASTIVISSLQGGFDNTFFITEIQVDGQLAGISPVIPEPASLALVALGTTLAAVARVRSRRR